MYLADPESEDPGVSEAFLPSGPPPKPACADKPGLHYVLGADVEAYIQHGLGFRVSALGLIFHRRVFLSVLVFLDLDLRTIREQATVDPRCQPPWSWKRVGFRLAFAGG